MVNSKRVILNDHVVYAPLDKIISQILPPAQASDASLPLCVQADSCSKVFEDIKIITPRIVSSFSGSPAASKILYFIFFTVHFITDQVAFPSGAKMTCSLLSTRYLSHRHF